MQDIDDNTRNRPISCLTYFFGEIERFPTSKSCVNYIGLCPRDKSSGERIRMGKITKRGPRVVRWALNQAVSHVVRKDEKFNEFYDRVKRRRGVNIARIAVERKLLTKIYWMLKKKKEWGLV